MSNNKDFKIKNGIKSTAYQEALGTVVSGSVGYSIASASYDNKSFSIGSEDTVPYKIRFNNDGTKLFMLGIVSDKVHQYTLSTAFDISTASYDSVNFSVASQETDAYGLAFNNDGTKMYITGNASDSIFQYSLSTGFDLSTASYDSVSLSVTSQGTIPTGITFNSTGSKLYMLGQISDEVHQYSLSTVFDLSTASYDSVSFSIASQETSPMDMSFNSDGTKMYIIGASSDAVFQYSLSTGFDISTASYDSISFNVNAQESNPRAVVFNNDGTKMYIVGSSQDTVFQYSTVLTTAELDLSTGSVFDYTPTSDVQVTLTNPAASGTSSGATLLLGSEDAAGVTGTFSTTLYEGTGAAQNIDNGLDLSTDGGLVWLKNREASSGDHWLFDTNRGAGYGLISHSTNAQTSFNNASLTSFNSNGFSLGDFAGVNTLNSFVSWAFKKQTKFFDIVTYTGDGTSNRAVSHSLNSIPGMIIIKAYDNIGGNNGGWPVMHNNGSADLSAAIHGINLNRSDSNQFGNNVTANFSSHITSTTFNPYEIRDTGYERQNINGVNYVAYLFAHDTSASSIIKCGSYTGTGASQEIDLGFEAQWVLIKNTTNPQSWSIIDNMRGFTVEGSNDEILTPNNNSVESPDNRVFPTASGFGVHTADYRYNGSGSNYIYVAISTSNIPTITYDPNLQWSGGTAPTAPATGETDVITFNTTDGGTTYKSALALDGAK
jgi:hypothetical protein